MTFTVPTNLLLELMRRERRLANRRPAGMMDDDQRKAMFARMRGGGGGGGRGGGRHGFDSEQDFQDWFSKNTGPEGDWNNDGVPNWMEHDAQGIQDATSDFAALALPGLGGLLGRLGSLGRALGGWKTSLGAGLGASGIGEYREAHPTMDPRGEKALALAEQILGYVSAISGLGTAKAKAGALLGPTKVGRAWDALWKSLGGYAEKAGEWLTRGWSPAAKDALAKAASGYQKVADYTGSSIADVISTQNTLEANLKRAAVLAGFGLKEGIEEREIGKLQRAIEESWKTGETWTYDPAEPRSGLGTALAMAAGTLGNPIEKQFRYDAYPAQTAAYRAAYDAIGKAEKSGEITPTRAEEMRQDLAGDKPFNMAGRGAWTFAPAAASYLTWQARDLADKLDRTTVETTSKVRDADTIETKERPDGIRFLDFNAPEIPHPEFAKGESDPAKRKIKEEGEYMGAEAARRINEMLKPGQAVRIVKDSHEKAAGMDVTGLRQLAYVETLPRPFDKLLHVPVLGEMIPAQDVSKKLIAEGLGDVRYRNLSGPTDRQLDRDAARREAESAKKGVWSEEGRQQLDWVGADPYAVDPNANLPAWRKAMLPAGLGLMGTGQSGVFSAMGSAGNAVASGWNAALAVGGGLEFNAKAAENKPIRASLPKGLQSESDKAMDAAMKKARRKRKKVSTTSTR